MLLKIQNSALKKAMQALSICNEKCQKIASTDSSNDFNSPFNDFNNDKTEADNFLSEIDIKADPNEFSLTEMNNFIDKISDMVDKFYNALSNIHLNIFVAVTPSQNNNNPSTGNALNP